MINNNEKRGGAERLFDAVTEIDHDLVDGSRPKDAKRRSHAVRKGIIAAVVAAAMALGVVGGIALHERRGKNAGGADEKTPAPVADDRERFNPFVVSAEYPVYETDRSNLDVANGYADAVSDVTREALVTLTKECLTNAEDDSALIAPTSVYVVLGLLSDVTAGETRDQLTALLGSDDAEEIHRQVSALWDSFYLDCEYSKSVVASSLWLNNNTEYNMDLINALAENYRATVASGQFGTEEYDAQLKGWLNDQTNGLLADKMENLKSDGLTSLVVISSIYRKAEWSMQFDEKDNTEETFHGLSHDEECTFMNKDSVAVYTAEGNGFTAVGLPLNDYSCMWFALPDEGVDMDNVICSDELWANIETWGKTETMERYRIINVMNVSVPRFDVSVEKDIIDHIRNLGVTDLFGGANFNPLFGEGTEGKYFVSKINHGARVIVNESGVEAAGYTEAELRTKGMSDTFVLDRPFVFIMTNSSGLPLFAGVVNQIN